MAADVVPGLLADIETAFNTHNLNDRQLSRITKRIRDGTATLADGHAYAVQIGKNSSKALQDVLTESNLPDGKLYYNIATRTVVPTLENNQKLINDAASEIQGFDDAKKGLHLKSVQPNFPKERITGLIDKMTAEDLNLEEALVWIKEPIVNNSEAFFDDFVKENADFRNGAGLKTKISRVAEATCCKWCEELEGTWDYGDAPEDIYRRHEFCRCVVTVTSERTSQNAWSKKQWESSREEIERRENTKPSVMSARERQEMLDRLEKDRSVKKVMDATGFGRRTAGEIVNGGPSLIQKELEKARNRRR